jgi:hypothetical protein
MQSSELLKFAKRLAIPALLLLTLTGDIARELIPMGQTGVSLNGRTNFCALTTESVLSTNLNSPVRVEFFRYVDTQGSFNWLAANIGGNGIQGYYYRFPEYDAPHVTTTDAEGTRFGDVKNVLVRNFISTYSIGDTPGNIATVTIDYTNIFAHTPGIFLAEGFSLNCEEQ